MMPDTLDARAATAHTATRPLHLHAAHFQWLAASSVRAGRPMCKVEPGAARVPGTSADSAALPMAGLLFFLWLHRSSQIDRNLGLPRPREPRPSLSRRPCHVWTSTLTPVGLIARFHLSLLFFLGLLPFRISCLRIVALRRLAITTSSFSPGLRVACSSQPILAVTSVAGSLVYPAV